MVKPWRKQLWLLHANPELMNSERSINMHEDYGQYINFRIMEEDARNLRATKSKI